MASPVTKKTTTPRHARELPKSPTGIHGLDEITFGGVPEGRTTLVCGGPGCAKTLMGMEFLVRGVTEFDESGVCMSFEETAEELAANVASLGFDVRALMARKKLAIDYVHIERSMIEEAGEYDLEALFVRLAHAIQSVGAKRVVLDSVESLFAGMADEGVLRSELRRLFRWLKEKKITAVVTAERGDRSLTRHGLEEYISDCVILLDHRVNEGVLTRRLRIVKYRGSTHGTNEYPFLIEHDGISVLPVTSAALSHPASGERISTGVPALDAMLGGKGIYRGSTMLISGTAGTGKTSLCAHFLDAACARGERCVAFAFEESQDQIVRNMRSIGIDLGRWIDRGLLHIHAARPTTFGLEMHLVKIHRAIAELNPRVVVVDPVTALSHSGGTFETQAMTLRLIDLLKSKAITAVLTSLSTTGNPQEQTSVAISSLVDTWLLLRDIESSGERNKGMYILKARGLAHSNQIREFLLTGSGVQLQNVYLGEAGMLTGSARLAQESRDAAEKTLITEGIESRRAALEGRRKALEAQISSLRGDLETEEHELRRFLAQEELKLQQREQNRADMARGRSRGEAAVRNDEARRRRK